MPWCEACNTFSASDELTGEGGCPSCGEVIGDPPKTPWHFKLLVVAVVVYLGWRAVQGVVWLIQHI
ncbi:MAG TPA: hypothetical protein VM390_08450 [Acidimicrobiales bacterium]|jgi:hypothetical protein|nr:hypothetical protein [Acidimicrobiales bacterium]